MPLKNIPLGQILLEEKLITPAQLDEALKQQKLNGNQKLGEILVAMGIVSERDLMLALESRLKVPFLDLSVTAIDPKAPALISQELAHKHNVIPIAIDGKTLTVATSDPMNFYAIDDIKLATNMDIKVVISALSDIKNAIGRYYSRMQAEDAAADLNREFGQSDTDRIAEQLGEKIDNAPVVRLVNSIIQQSVKIGASDIHIEPMENQTRVRMRVDGVLQTQMTLATAAHASVIARLKIMSNMNIAERRLPQDGRVETVIDGQPVDLRLSTLPTVLGEKMVIRVLGSNETVLSRSALGFTPKNLALYEKIIQSPNGLILVSGPTGSGKTTTLYSILNEYNKPGVNIITIEDPVEFRLSGVNQVQINPKAGLTFAAGLRSILRQDPDIIMVGEIRDSETAQIAVRAAITGHLVVSTIHTNDAVSTITRLINMGIQPYLVSSGTVGIIAQRLVRKICPRCKKAYESTAYEHKLLGLEEGTTVYKGTGCNNCGNTGYKGRTAIHEIMIVDKGIRELIDSHASADTLRDHAIKSGMVLLHDIGRNLVLDGVTTVEEIQKITYNAG